MSCLVLSCLVKKACCTCKVVVFPKKPIAVLTFSLPSPSPSSLLKLAINRFVSTVAYRDKTLPRIQNTYQNSKTSPRIQKYFGYWDVFWVLVSVFGFWEMFCPYDITFLYPIHGSGPLVGYSIV